MLNVKPKAGEVVDGEAELDGISVGDDEMEVEGEVEGKSEPVGIGMVPMVLTASTFPEGVVVDPDDVLVGVVAPPQSVADTVTVDTTVTVTMLFVPMTTVGVATPFVPEEVEVVEMELEATDVGLRVGSEDLGTIVGVDEDVEI